MGYSDYDEDDKPDAVTTARPARDAIGIVNGLLGIVVRLIGIGLLVVGLMVGIEVVIEAWALYRDPARIQAFADALEHGTRVDALIRGLSEGERGAAGGSTNNLSISFLLAWFIAPMLLFTAGYLAMAAVRTGGSLALMPGSSRVGR